MRTGFSYPEVVITVGIMAFVLILFHATLVALPSGRQINHQDLALRIATHELETLRSNGFYKLPASGSFTDSLLSTLPQGTTTLTIASSTINSGSKDVTVVVSWKEPEAVATSTINLTTMITMIGGLP